MPLDLSQGFGPSDRTADLFRRSVWKRFFNDLLPRSGWIGKQVGPVVSG
jgi:hypothetical protein